MAITLILIEDGGATWKKRVTLEDTPDEYSYPCVVQTLTETIHAFFNRQDRIISPDALPEDFQNYEQAVFAIFQNERRWAIFKASGLRIARVALRIIVTPLKWVTYPLRLLYSHLRSRFVREPSLGEIIRLVEGIT